MGLLDYLLTSGIAAALIVVAGWLGRKYLAAYVTESVKHDFEKQMEALRADIRSKETQIEALRSGALSRMATIHAAQAERRMDAADKLWVSVKEWNVLKGASATMSVYNFDECSKRIEREPKLQAIFEMQSKLCPESISGLGQAAHSARPYLADSTWALYQAYTSVLALAFSKIMMLAKGIDGREFMNFGASDGILEAALPEYAAYIKEHSHSAHHHLLEALSNKILAELRRTIEGQEQDSESVKRAAGVLRAVEEMQREMQEAEAKAERA